MGFGVQAIRAVRRALGDVPIVYTLHEYLPICANHGQMIKARTHALCTKASPSDCGMCFPEIGAGNMLRRELFVKSFFAEVDAFVSPSHFLLSRFADWGLPPEKLVMIENGLEGGTVTPPRPAAPGARRNRFAYFGQLNPFKGIRVLVDAVTRVPKEVWGDSRPLRLRRQPRAPARRVPARRSASSSASPAAASASAAATRATSSPASCARSTG